MKKNADMVLEGGKERLKRKHDVMIEPTRPTIATAGGQDGPKEGMLRNHCEVTDSTTPKLGDGCENWNISKEFKMPRIPRKVMCV